MPVIKTNKESIIKKTIHLFKVHGYYNTTMADIGRETGLIKGSIYHHFKSKEDLALSCLVHIHQYFSENIYSIAYAKNLTDKEKLKQFTYGVEAYFLNSEGGCLLGNFALELSNNIPLLKDEIVSYFEKWEEALYKILKAELGDIKAKNKSKQIVASTQGSIMMMRLYGSNESFKKLNQEVLKTLS